MVTYGQAFDFIVLLWIISIILLIFMTAGICIIAKKLSRIYRVLTSIETEAEEMNSGIERTIEEISDTDVSIGEVIHKMDEIRKEKFSREPKDRRRDL